MSIANTMTSRQYATDVSTSETSTTRTRDSKVDVLIIGAGPSGLMCANALACAGVDVRIIDQRPDKVTAGQADGIQPRTIEVLQSYGLAERLLKEGNQMHMAAFYNPSLDGDIELTTRAPDVIAPTARYPFEITLHQGAIEAIFLDSMRSNGLEVQRPIVPTVIEISQDEDLLNDPKAYPIKVTLKHLNIAKVGPNEEIVRAKFVVGTDGAHSWVRKSFGITMEGEQTDYIWGVIDFTPDTDFPDIRNRCAIHSNSGSCMIIPREGDKVRLYIQLSDPSLVKVMDGRVDKSKVGPQELLEAGRKSLRPYRLETPEEFDWWTLYIIGQRVASSFSVHERVFIAGDACHTHSPKAGQGMNASMNDTHNLAWKLAYVLRGWADLTLLKTYEFERRKYAQDLITFDKKFSALFSGKPRSELNPDGVSHDQFIEAFQTFGGFTSGIGVHYAPSIIVQQTAGEHSDLQHYASNAIIGQRMPPIVLTRAADSRPVELQDLLVSDTRFKVLAFLGDPRTDDKSQGHQQMQAIEELGQHLQALLTSFESKLEGTTWQDIFDVIAILRSTKRDVRYNALPAVFRTHWSKVYIDDLDVTGKIGGHVYSTFSIDNTDGAIIVVRPDGYVGIITPLRGAIQLLELYFSSFMRMAS